MQITFVNLLVCDECHRAVKKDPYNCIMQEFYHDRASEVGVDIHADVGCCLPRFIETFAELHCLVFALCRLQGQLHVWHKTKTDAYLMLLRAVCVFVMFILTFCNCESVFAHDREHSRFCKLHFTTRLGCWPPCLCCLCRFYQCLYVVLVCS